MRVHRVGPPDRQRVLDAILVEEEHPILGPGLTDREEHELAAMPRMEPMSHPDSPLRSNGIRSS